MSDAPTGTGPFSLTQHPAHLASDGGAVVQPAFTGQLSWYQGYGERHGADGDGGRLVSMHSFDSPWDTWERHPHGAELVVVTQGKLTLIQEHEGAEVRIELSAGDYAINPPGVWHTADASQPATALFLTSGRGTEHRPR